MGNDIDTIKWTMCREKKSLENSILDGMCILNPSPKRSGIYMEEDGETL